MTEVSLSKNKELAYEYMEQVLACSSRHSLKAYYVGEEITPKPKFTNRKDWTHMEQVLELVFKTAEGDTKVITVTDPRTDITAEEAQEAMETILAANVIETNGGDLTEIVEARMRVTQVTVLK